MVPAKINADTMNSFIYVRMDGVCGTVEPHLKQSEHLPRAATLTGDARCARAGSADGYGSTETRTSLEK